MRHSSRRRLTTGVRGTSLLAPQSPTHHAARLESIVNEPKRRTGSQQAPREALKRGNRFALRMRPCCLPTALLSLLAAVLSGRRGLRWPGRSWRRRRPHTGGKRHLQAAFSPVKRMAEALRAAGDRAAVEWLPHPGPAGISARSGTAQPSSKHCPVPSARPLRLDSLHRRAGGSCRPQAERAPCSPTLLPLASALCACCRFRERFRATRRHAAGRFVPGGGRQGRLSLRLCEALLPGLPTAFSRPAEVDWTPASGSCGLGWWQRQRQQRRWRRRRRLAAGCWQRAPAPPHQVSSGTGVVMTGAMRKGSCCCCRRRPARAVEHAASCCCAPRTPPGPAPPGVPVTLQHALCACL